MAIKLFISHANEDAVIAKKVTRLIEECFNEIDKEEILCISVKEYKLYVGMNIVDTLWQKLHDSEVVLGLLTRKALRSSWVLAELGMAWGLSKGKKKKLVLPVLFGVSVKELPGPYIVTNAGNAKEYDDWFNIILQISSKISWKIKKEPAVKRAIMNFIKTLGSFPNALDHKDVEVLEAIRVFREHEDDEPVRVLDGPVQSTSMAKNRRTTESHFRPVDYEKLCRLFKGASRAGAYDLPYAKLHEWSWPNLEGTVDEKVQAYVNCNAGEFELASLSVSHKLFQVQAFAQFVRSKILTSDRFAVRLDNVDFSTDPPTLFIRKARYSDQVQSNHVLTWKGNADNWIGSTGLQRPLPIDRDWRHKGTDDDLHSLVLGENDRWLPPLDKCPYLANTMGVAVILFYKKKHKWIPILLDRTSEPGEKAIYQEGISCTASGALTFYEESSGEMKSSCESKTLIDLVRPWLLSQIKQKASIKEDKIDILLPLALCREFQRGGKPQLFYAGAIKHNIGETLLEVYRTTTAKDSKQKLRPVVKIHNIEELLCSPAGRRQFTPEFVANWYYASRNFLPWLKSR